MVVRKLYLLKPHWLPRLQGGFLSHCRGALCSRPPDTSLGGMDDLAAAAAVLVMSMDSESDDDMDLGDELWCCQR